ncbi:MobA/MobL family protein [Sphingomonas floccifaciens]|uniref:MobA/MobL family protein n=1 Tax=Sphingomonas floccifaciens TaxID=1844115 RepID=A0ABW4NDH1_9SPHN
MGAERYVVDEHYHAGGSRTAFVISNISDDPRTREAFWDAAHVASATPSKPRLEIRPHRGDLAELVRLADEDGTPVAVERALRELAQEGAGPHRRIHLIDLDQATFDWAQTLDEDRYGTRRDDRLVHIVRPRGGVLQWRIETEFAYELDGDDDRTVAQDYGRMLDSLGLKYTIAAHHPTHRNDLRNRHPHILIYPGACRRRDDGSWEFGGKLQAGDIALGLGAVDKTTLAKLWFEQRSAADVAALRRAFADMVNARLERRGVRRRYDPRTFAEMGIDQAPGEHLGSAAAARVEAGDAIDIDRRNAIRGWDGRRRQTARDIAAELARHCAVIARVEDTDARGSDADLAALRDQHIALTDRLAGLLELLADHDLSTEMARSAADRLATKSGDALAAIEAGTASAAEMRASASYRARNELALAHLDAVDDVLMPHADTIRTARAEVAGMRRALHGIADRITARVAQLEHARDVARRAAIWSSETVLLPTRHPAPLGDDAHFEALVEHIRNQRSAEWATSADRFVQLVRADGTGDLFTPIGLRASDEALIVRQPYARRFAGVLREAGKRQEEEIGRVLAYIAAHGEDGLLGNDTDTAPRTVRRHYRLYRDHPTFCDLLQDARARFETASRASSAVVVGVDMPVAEPAIVVSPDNSRVPIAMPPADLRIAAPTLPKAPTVSSSSVPESDPMAKLISPSRSVAQPVARSPSTSATPVTIPAYRGAEDHQTAAAPPVSQSPLGGAAEVTATAPLSNRTDGGVDQSVNNARDVGKASSTDATSARESGRSIRVGDVAATPEAQTQTSVAASVDKVDRAAPTRQERAAVAARLIDAEARTNPPSAGAVQTAPRPRVAGRGLEPGQPVTTPSVSDLGKEPEAVVALSDTGGHPSPSALAEQVPMSDAGDQVRVGQSVMRSADPGEPDPGEAPGDVGLPDRNTVAPPRHETVGRASASPTERLRDLVRQRPVHGTTSPPDPSPKPATRTTLSQPPPSARPKQIEHDRRLQSVHQVVATFREHTLYARLDKSGQRTFDDSMQEPLNDIVAGRASLRIDGGVMLAATASDEVMDRLRALAVSDAGYWLLVRIAETVPGDAERFDSWQVLDQRGGAMSLPSTGRHGPGIGD